MISVIIPMWNNSYKTIDRCINSILKQWVNKGEIDTEIILIDDAATDRVTRRKGTEYSRSLTNVKYDRLFINSGVCCARNRGLSICSGEHICYLDSDDVYYPTRFQSVLGNLSVNDLIIQPYDIDEFDYDRKLINKSKKFLPNFIGITHNRAIMEKVFEKYGEVFPSGVVDNGNVIAYNRLLEFANKPLTLTNTIGHVTIRPTGQSTTKRKPDNIAN